MKTAADLYDKVAGFEDTFMSVGDLITRLSGTFDKASETSLPYRSVHYP